MVKVFTGISWLDQMKENSENQNCCIALSSLLRCSQTPGSKSVTHSYHHEHNCNTTHRTYGRVYTNTVTMGKGQDHWDGHSDQHLHQQKESSKTTVISFTFNIPISLASWKKKSCEAKSTTRVSLLLTCINLPSRFAWNSNYWPSSSIHLFFPDVVTNSAPAVLAFWH